MKRMALTLLTMLVVGSSTAWAACCYFAAIDKDVTQPGQRAFITWDDEAGMESFTVQPTFEGNAADFGMVIPTPSQPKLQEMPRDFFRALALFTILEPMDMSKFKPKLALTRATSLESAQSVDRAQPVRVLEKGVVGSLDYKILEADRADALFEWLKQNKYSYSGDTDTLSYYVKKKWNFTVMKIDPRQMKKQTDGSYQGEVTPTRFTFKSDKPIYPLRITKISVKDRTDALLYVMARQKMDMPERWSYQPTFLPMWRQAMSFAVPEKLTKQEKDYLELLAHTKIPENSSPSQLEWAGRLTGSRVKILNDVRLYNRQAPPEEIAKLKVLNGHLKMGWYMTKFRHVFTVEEMTEDLVLVPATIGKSKDELEYVSILPTSPP